MPLVSRDGPRVVRGRRGGRGDERRLRLHQSGPRGAARHRRRLHERHRRAHRAGRLAHDVLPDARRTAVLLRHLLPQRCFSAASFGCGQYLAGAPRRGRAELGPHREGTAVNGVRIARRRTAGRSGAMRPCRRRGVARRGHRPWRIRRRAEIPAVGAAGGAAAALGAHRLTAGPGRCPPYRNRDGPRRHVRPAGRRVCPLQRRQCLGGTAFREDAVRQRVAVAGLRALGQADRRPAGASGHRRDREVPARRVTLRRHVHLVAGRRRRRPRGLDLCLDARAADRGARRRRRALGRFGFRRDRGRNV